MEETIKKWYELPMGLEDVRSSIRANIRTAARSFVAIGFYLKRAREDRLYEEAGFSSVWDFAREEFGISRSTATRYMAVNDRFSADGNSPNLATEYQAYNQSQLIEMVTMTGEQLEQVTPDMTVRELREMKQEDTVEPEETQIVGQMEISDFPEYMPEPAESDNLPEIVVPAIEIPLSDLTAMTVEEPENNPEVCATSHTEEELKPKIKNTMEPEIREQYCDAFARKLITEFRNWFLKDFDGRVTDVCSSEVELKKRFTGTWYFLDPVTGGNAHINLFSDYIQIWSRDGQCLGNTEWFYLCAAIQAMWNITAMEDAAKMQQNEPERCENSSEEETPMTPEEPEETSDTELEVSQPAEYDRQTLVRMIGDTEEFLEQMRDYWMQNQPHTYTKYAMQLQAYKNLLADMDKADQEPEAEQPELPVMRNNDQRKEWLRNYQSWGLWYADEHIGCRYYKYDFDNGARLIAEEYSAYNEVVKNDLVFSYLHLVGGPEPPKHPMYGYGKWERHETYNRHPDSETELVEFLKEIQKGER